MSSMRARLAKLEQALAGMTLSDPGPDRCPTCQSTDLMDPGREEVLTIHTWSYEEVDAACMEITQRKARLAWCKACKKLVPTGTHDPDWARQFGEGCEGPELRRNMRDMKLLRDVMGLMMETLSQNSSFLGDRQWTIEG